jgi:16S rRNA (guanine(966)-N(2))-methyltransferase RsmD
MFAFVLTNVRIIAGKFRGRKLKSPPSLDVRPTSDRLRETLFNVIAPRMVGARFLDLCAGSGAVGIEALSRGAAHATFVDQSREMCMLTKSNLELCRIEENDGEIVQVEASAFLQRVALQPRGAARSGRQAAPWDIIFFDPPYAVDYDPVLDILGAQSTTLFTENGLVVVEHHRKKELPEQTGALNRYRVLKQGDSSLSFYEVTDFAS